MDIKPCPVCGGHASIGIDRMHFCYWCIRCDKCGHTTGKSYVNSDDAIWDWNMEDGEPMIEIKPCPFCGGTPKMDHWNGSLFLQCQCGARGPESRVEEKAIDKWNKRV